MTNQELCEQLLKQSHVEAIIGNIRTSELLKIAAERILRMIT